MSTKRVIIIGGAGFLGSHLAQTLSLVEGIEPICADLVRDPELSVDFLPVDLLDPNSLDVLPDFDVLVNCSGQVSKPFNLCYRLNTAGIANLLERVRGTSFRVIQISTTAVYGSGGHCDESSSLNPETNYATAKAIAEYQLQSALEASRLTILRLSNLYGPGQQKGIAAYLLRSYYSDRRLVFNNNGNLYRSFIHVQDAAAIVLSCVRSSEVGGVFNVKGPDSYSVMSLIERFEDEFKIEFEKEFTDGDPWENIRDLDDARIRTALDPKYNHNIMGHFKQMVKGHPNG